MDMQKYLNQRMKNNLIEAFKQIGVERTIETIESSYKEPIRSRYLKIAWDKIKN